MKTKIYKAYDFITGKTYLIGAFDSKAEATAHCKANKYATIAQTIQPLTDEEFSRALKSIDWGGRTG